MFIVFYILIFHNLEVNKYKNFLFYFIFLTLSRSLKAETSPRKYYISISLVLTNVQGGSNMTGTDFFL